MSTLIELQVLAKQRGLRGFRKYSKKELCEKLNIEYSGDGCKAITVTLKNTTTSGDTLHFRSLHELSIVLKRNPGSMSYANKTKKKIIIEGCDLIPDGEYVIHEQLIL